LGERRETSEINMITKIVFIIAGQIQP